MKKAGWGSRLMVVEGFGSEIGAAGFEPTTPTNPK
jgi:hypothetical protein